MSDQTAPTLEPPADRAELGPLVGPQPPPRANSGRGRRLLRRLGTAMAVLGVVALAYGATIYLWRDPVTDLWARWKQHELTDALDQQFTAFRSQLGASTPGVGGEPAPGAQEPTPLAPVAADVPPDGPDGGPAPAPAPAAPVEPRDGGGPTAASGQIPRAPAAAQLTRATASAARVYLAALGPGEAIGRIRIPKLGIDPVFVNGTATGDLAKGPGRYEQALVPGLGRVTAIAGHRTTFGAPFRHVDRLEPGDAIELELPYGAFTYRVTGHEIVAKDDWSILAEEGYDRLVLSACHPLYSASQRWIVYARLARVQPYAGPAYSIDATGQATVVA